MAPFPTIAKVESFVPSSKGSGGDYHRQGKGHWIVDTYISNPMSQYEEYRASRTSWGIGVLGSLFVKVTASDGTEGIATGFGGPPSCWLIENHFKQFVVGKDPRDLNLMWDQMFKASMFYGRKGITLATISVVDLAIWDLLGKLRGEPVYKMIGGRTKEKIPFYCTGPLPNETKRMGFWGAKVPLPYSPSEGPEGLRKNVEFLRKHRESVGPDFPLMVDCWMSLNITYAVEIAQKCIDEKIDIYWWEEVLHPDDFDGHKLLKERMPTVRWTTGEHEYSRYGHRKLIEGRSIDIIQPDVMWIGGLTELLKVSAMASAYDIPVVPHGSGPYSYHFIMSQAHSPFCEYIANSPDGKSIHPCFGDLFLNEPLPIGGILDVSDAPGFGLELNPQAVLIPAAHLLTPAPEKPLSVPTTNGTPNAAHRA
ncbi:mandelate racemase/muconate lactonizing enzyme family protein [Dacryopinax primogenitus]|uniref:Mandelate racemase/muconate lactonizing enzyme family protein n=1 Tax=Dacryopinax primogenitus (strain DJM 731) TaxID=1858805 RepID=M5GEV7_DACPD|nr:mandelate racemase/muconate lactonizing enzyme family protein [Dacryopinax primogenitus]EJU03623.1 mandelate racemase/muconate lactonizing enzyme family protein [Dacryopinax primogenitus]